MSLHWLWSRRGFRETRTESDRIQQDLSPFENGRILCGVIAIGGCFGFQRVNALYDSQAKRFSTRILKRQRPGFIGGTLSLACFQLQRDFCFLG